MKHSVLRQDQSDNTGGQVRPPHRHRYVDIIVARSADQASAGIIIDLFGALNALLDNQTYVVSLRVLAEDPAGGPLYWSGRTALFWGDTEHAWRLDGAQKSWVSQVMNLAPRSVLVGGAVMVLAQSGGADPKIAAVHTSFQAAACESGIYCANTSTYRSDQDRLHSANTGISALRLLAEFVSLDHGEHLADALRRYVGLAEPEPAVESPLAHRLIRKANGDALVIQTLQTMLDNIENPLKIHDLSLCLGTSTRQLQRRYQRKTGAKLLETYKELRLERVATLLRHTDMSLLEIASATGFSSRAALSRAFSRHRNTRPETIRNRRYTGAVT